MLKLSLSLESSDHLLHCIEKVLIYSNYEAKTVFTTIFIVWRMLLTLRKLLVSLDGLFVLQA